MGFPVPLNEWMKSELKDFVCGIFETGRDIGRTFFHSDVILENLSKEGKFSRKIWGLLSLEIWMQQFHDKAIEYKKLSKIERNIMKTLITGGLGQIGSHIAEMMLSIEAIKFWL